MSCSTDNATIRIKGSDTEVNLVVLLAESFRNVDDKVFVSISGGGSGLGITSLMNGTADIANSSRSITKEEMQLFANRKIKIDSFVFAQDAIAFVVAADLAIDSINTRELSELLSGKQKSWLALTEKDLPVNIYGRQSNSGTHDFIKKKLSIEFTPYAKQMSGNAQILEAIRTDHSGIGYVGAGYVANGNSKGIKVLTIYTRDHRTPVSPLDSLMIAKGNYFFQRPLYQYYMADSYEKVKPFLDYEKSKEGKNIIKSSGYYPIKVIEQFNQK